MWHRVASPCETQPQQGSVTSHLHRHEPWSRYRYKNSYRLVPEDVLSPVTPPPVPVEQSIEVDDEDMQPPDQPQQSMQPPVPLGGSL